MKVLLLKTLQTKETLHITIFTFHHNIFSMSSATDGTELFVLCETGLIAFTHDISQNNWETFHDLYIFEIHNLAQCRSISIKIHETCCKIDSTEKYVFV